MNCGCGVDKYLNLLVWNNARFGGFSHLQNSHNTTIRYSSEGCNKDFKILNYIILMRISKAEGEMITRVQSNNKIFLL